MAEDPPQRLDKALARDVPVQAALSRTRLSRLIAEGAVLLNGQPVTDQTRKIAAGDAVEITVPQAQDSYIGPQDIPLDVVFEDDDLVVINKAVGMVVHPAPGSPDGTLVNALLHHCGDSLSGVGGQKRPGIVHRIDKDTSGLLVVAKTDRAHHGLAAQFEAHKVERYYRAVVFGAPDANDPRLRGVKGVNFESGNIMRLTTQLARHKTDRQRQAVLFQGGRHAVTRARIVERFGTPNCCSLSRMLARDWPHPSDQGAYGARRTWVDWGSSLWWTAQAFPQSDFARCAGAGEILSTAGASCRCSGFQTPRVSSKLAVRGTCSP